MLKKIICAHFVLYETMMKYTLINFPFYSRNRFLQILIVLCKIDSLLPTAKEISFGQL